MALKGVTMTLDDQSLMRIKSSVAKILLDNALKAPAERARLTQRDLAGAVGADWYDVHMSLKSLKDTGAIKIDRNRILVDRVLLRDIAGRSAAV
jgi:hypothetical protein